jgi:hypothetical protein
MKKLLLCASVAALTLCLNPRMSFSMEVGGGETTASETQNKESVTKYLASDIQPKVALYGEGDAHTREQDYTPFLTVDKNPKTCPKVIADITNPRDMAVIPDGQLDRVELRNLETTVFSRNPEDTCKDIGRVLKPQGELKFNDMCGGQDADKIKVTVLEAYKKLKIEDPVNYKQLEEMPSKDMVAAFQADGGWGRLNPFDQYLDQNDFAQLSGKKFHETTVFHDYKVQLSQFFAKVGFENLTLSEENGWIFWSVYKK